MTTPAQGLDRPAKTKDVSTRFVNMLVYGLHGVGKTYLASTGPKPVYVLDCDIGTMSLGDFDDIYFERVKNLQEVNDRIQYLKQGFAKDPEFYKVVVVDNLTEMQSLIMYSLTNGKQAQMQDWGNILTAITAIVRDIRELPCHKLFIAQQQKNSKDQTISPALSGSIASKIPEYFDVVGHYAVNTVMQAVAGDPRNMKATNVRAIQCWPSAQVTAKDRSGKLEEYEHPLLSTIIKKIQTKKETNKNG